MDRPLRLPTAIRYLSSRTRSRPLAAAVTPSPAQSRAGPERSLHGFFFSSRSRHTRCLSDWSSDVCSSDLMLPKAEGGGAVIHADAKLAAREAIAGLADGHVKIVAIATETAQALFLAGTYRGASADRKSVV